LDEQQRKKYIFLDEMHILLTFPEIGYLHKVGGHDRQIWDG